MILKALILAYITLPDSSRPSNLPGMSEIGEDPTGGNHPEIVATQTAILYVGHLLSQVLLFTASIAIVFIVISGANYIFSLGKEERIERGKQGIFWSLMGLIIILFSYSIVQGVISILLKVDSSTG